MRFTKEMLAAKKESIRRGMILTADRPVTTPFAKSAPASDLSEFASVSTHLLSRSPRPRAGSEHASLRHRSK